MLVLSNTENLVGIRISGDYWDFEELKQAIEKLISTHIFTHENFVSPIASLHRFCNRLVHTIAGESSIETTYNGINETIKTNFDTNFPSQNIYFSTEEFWPEIYFNLICLHHLIEESYKIDDKRKLLPHVLTLQKFQSTIYQCINLIIGPKERLKLEEDLFKISMKLNNYPLQYIDLLNIKYLSFSNEKRIDYLAKILRSLYDENREYMLFKHRLKALSKSTNTALHTVVLEFDYPEKIIW
ncbi:MAG: hypothetical protein KBT36_03015 [Kurthia sp.]|nr:hypothetical protein [Candidatus Kurthia equi]